MGYSSNFLINLAGTPPHNSFGGTSLLTSAPAAMTLPVPISTPPSTVARAPSQQLPMVIGRTTPSPQRRSPGPISCVLDQSITPDSRRTLCPRVIAPPLPTKSVQRRLI